jgi:hypothetical protein
VPEIIDTVFTKTSPIRSFSMTEYERFGLVFTKTRVYKFGHGIFSIPVVASSDPGTFLCCFSFSFRGFLRGTGASLLTGIQRMKGVGEEPNHSSGSLPGFFSIPVVASSDRGTFLCCFSFSFRGFSRGDGASLLTGIQGMKGVGEEPNHSRWVFAWILRLQESLAL